MLRLESPEMGVDATAHEKLRMDALLHQAPIREHQDLVGVGDG